MQEISAKDVFSFIYLAGPSPPIALFMGPKNEITLWLLLLSWA
uniref:Uncharacterized protein n=1 Tax=Magnetospirillum gryphiswaldense TaxID=55518 RepID=A4TU23_9PROT|nr:hypothetical protein MGR_2062 [Magnetospirillum gryphiswaldense MSR-1]